VKGLFVREVSVVVYYQKKKMMMQRKRKRKKDTHYLPVNELIYFPKKFGCLTDWD
jgi:hypothetical protein